MKDRHRHTTVFGETIDYEASPELAAFLARAVAMAEDPARAEDELVTHLYSSENPLLDPTIFQGRGAVTRETFDDPAYQVMLALLDRKRVAMGALDLDRVRACFSMTVDEAAHAFDVPPPRLLELVERREISAIRFDDGLRIDQRSVESWRPRAQSAAQAR